MAEAHPGQVEAGPVVDHREPQVAVGLADLPHPKHPDNPAYLGVGLMYGLSEFRTEKGNWLTPEAQFEEADTRLERYKRGECDETPKALAW